MESWNKGQSGSKNKLKILKILKIVKNRGQFGLHHLFLLGSVSPGRWQRSKVFANRGSPILSPRRNTTYIFFLYCNHQNATKCTRAHFLPIEARRFSLLGTTLRTHIPSLQSSKCNKMQPSRAHFLLIKARGFCNLSTTPFSCNLHFSIVNESSECTAS